MTIKELQKHLEWLISTGYVNEDSVVMIEKPSDSYASTYVRQLSVDDVCLDTLRVPVSEDDEGDLQHVVIFTQD